MTRVLGVGLEKLPIGHPLRALRRGPKLVFTTFKSPFAPQIDHFQRGLQPANPFVGRFQLGGVNQFESRLRQA